MTVFDRQNLENILREQELSLGGNFSEVDFIRIGQLTNARLVVFGSITKVGNNFTLELAVTDVETGERKASYLPRQVSLLTLENLSVIREASADLLGQLGVNLTVSARQELGRAEDTARIQAENALARGIAADRQGTMAEALTFYFQAAAFDPSLMREALNRVSVVSANISTGSLGQNIRNRMQEYDSWRAILEAAGFFYSNHLPYEFVYNTNIRDHGINFERMIADLSIEISLVPTDAWKTINDLREGLRVASRDEWNHIPLQTRQVFEPGQIEVTIQIINNAGTILSTASEVFLHPSETNRINRELFFRNVNVNEITDRLTIQVVNINGIPAQRAGETGYIQISSIHRSWDVLDAEQMADRRRQEQEDRRRQQAQAAEARRNRRAEWRREYSIVPPVAFELGYVYKPGYPFGFRLGTHGFYTTWNFHFPDWQGHDKRLHNFYDENGIIYENGWVFGAFYRPIVEFLDQGIRVQRSFEWALGLSINIIDNFLMIPFGLGARHSHEYGLFEARHRNNTSEKVWIPAGRSERYDTPNWEHDFLFEVGLAFNPIKWLSILGTYRLVGFQEHNFTIGTSLTVPRVKR
jgi:hypothetical protein